MDEKGVSSKGAILAAARKEFAARGFSGARVEAIARAAGCNKAMLFYYFSSKENLYRSVLAQALGEIFAEIGGVVNERLTPRSFLERFPEIYIRFLARNPDLPRILVFDLIHNPENISRTVGQIFRENASFNPQLLLGMIRTWHDQGLISEGDPMHFILNVISLSIFSFVGRPMVEAISGLKAGEDEEFYRARIQSVVHTLTKGMLK
ncbi:MAG: TetR family transcriptional regulator [Acidobacteriota bacterium]|jgi:AcrR family transcriptional regulator|nr:TetR family transcriptional regulator [Acidobacteriota bacterium]